MVFQARSLGEISIEFTAATGAQGVRLLIGSDDNQLTRLFDNTGKMVAVVVWPF